MAGEEFMQISSQQLPKHFQKNSMAQSLSNKLARIFFSSASLLAGILVAVVIQAVLSSVWDNF